MGRLVWAMAGLMLALALAPTARAEDGYDLWLRYVPEGGAVERGYRAAATTLHPVGDSATIRAATAELERGLSNLTARAVMVRDGLGDGAVVYGSANQPEIAALIGQTTVAPEGYILRSVRSNGRRVTVIAGGSDVGVLYGAFDLLRRMQTRQPIDALDVVEAPAVQLRLLNHWDNLDRTVERGYAGQSIWDWHTLPGFTPQRYTDYARANASIGINGTVLNNVNANALSLTEPYLRKAAALADIFRPYSIKVYLSARFSAPIEIGGLATADPLDPAVQTWWKAKANEIYRLIPDFGGFLVKANSEGQPGPQDYHRTHAEGANLLADAVAPHGGMVMWRAFVYAHDNPEDRAKQAFDDFVPLDGQFRDNVIVQVKNGAIDFQPREPFHPLFGAMPKTPLMMEFQITKEYLGQATHLAYLGPLFEEVLRADTHQRGAGSTVAKVVDGSLFGHRLTGIAGVANIGTDRNWSGSDFNQANWYVFGRMAWDPEHADAAAIAREWAAMSFTPDPRFVEPAVGMMMRSREAVVDYMTPLGLHHLMATGHHYGPGPWVRDLARPEWNPTYYHQADAAGIGFDRTANGSDAVSQYAPEVARLFADPATTPEAALLWFHHLPWTYRMQSGRSLWDELVLTYGHGVNEVAAMQATWATLEDFVDPERFHDTTQLLVIQHDEAQWWRDASVAYFHSRSGLLLPAGAAPPPHPLAWYEALSFPYAPGH
ncbi:MAG: alpha-glucuronidase [Brevundimonas sp.]|nr:MAG: alpha-glucuronidase [Brevundimonas sp.]